MIDIPRAFTYIFDDPDWVSKVIVTAIVSVMSTLLTPFLIGLVGWAILLGYQVELVRNVRLGYPRPLPVWDDFGRYLSLGTGVIVAFVAYNVPNLLLGFVSLLIASNAGEGLLSGGLIMTLTCCLLPILLVYNLIIQPLFALGMGRYADEPTVGVFFEFGVLIAALRSRQEAVIQWVLGMIIASLVYSLLGVVPCLGWLAIAGVSVLISGSLNGQLAAAALGKGKAKPKRG